MTTEKHRYYLELRAAKFARQVSRQFNTNKNWLGLLTQKAIKLQEDIPCMTDYALRKELVNYFADRSDAAYRRVYAA